MPRFDGSGDDAPPSLFGVPGRPSPAAERGSPGAWRMLAALDSRPGERRDGGAASRKGVLAALICGVLAVGAAGWWQLNGRASPVDASAPVVAGAAQPAAASLPVEASVAAPATIEVVPMAGRALSLEAASVPASAAASRPAATSHPARQRPSSPNRVVAKAPAAPEAPARVGRGDSDVDLMTAMVAHLEGDPVRPAVAQAGSNPAPADQPAMHARTVATLLRSCKQFGPSEAARCRQQICEGQWGRVSACPVRLDAARR